MPGGEENHITLAPQVSLVHQGMDLSSPVPLKMLKTKKCLILGLSITQVLFPQKLTPCQLESVKKLVCQLILLIHMYSVGLVNLVCIQLHKYYQSVKTAYMLVSVQLKTQ